VRASPVGALARFLACALGVEHRLVGAAKQALGVGGVSRVDGPSDAPAHVQVVAVGHERLAARLAQPVGQRLGILLGGLAVDQDRELVATEAGHHVGGADPSGQALADQRQDLVADLVPELVVDRLEAVQVDVEPGQTSTASKAATAVNFVAMTVIWR
jgi:hypothetical protein